MRRDAGSIGTQLIDILSSIHQKRPFPSTRLIFSSGEQTKCVNSRQAEGREEGQQKHPEGVLRQLWRINLPSLARVHSANRNSTQSFFVFCFRQKEKQTQKNMDIKIVCQKIRTRCFMSRN
jgi:hypothetical protein